LLTIAVSDSQLEQCQIESREAYGVVETWLARNTEDRAHTEGGPIEHDLHLLASAGIRGHGEPALDRPFGASQKGMYPTERMHNLDRPYAIHRGVASAASFGRIGGFICLCQQNRITG
jgi:hypothetical protein